MYERKGFGMTSENIKGGRTVRAVWDLAEPAAQSLNLILWDVLFLKEGASWFLRIFIDKEGGVTLDDCEAFSRAVDPLLDEADPIEQSYYLEVSSPGIERELRLPYHFEHCMGQAVRLKLIRPVDGVREFSGVLSGFEGGCIHINQGGQSMQFLQKDVARIRVEAEI